MKLIEKLAATEVSSFPARSVMLAQELQHQRQMMLNQAQQTQFQQQQMQEQMQTAGGAQTPQAAEGQQATRGQGRGEAGGNKARIELIVKQPGASPKKK
jgi:hypothetical protein